MNRTAYNKRNYLLSFKDEITENLKIPICSCEKWTNTLKEILNDL